MRGGLLAVLAAVLAVGGPAPAWAAGGVLTVPEQVQAPAGGRTTLDASFSYPGSGPICTTRVNFTWDGAGWLAEYPLPRGSNCVATAVGAAPAGGDRAGPHTISGSAGSQFRDCRTVTIVSAAAPLASGAPGVSALRRSLSTVALLASVGVLAVGVLVAGGLVLRSRRRPRRSLPRP